MAVNWPYLWLGLAMLGASAWVGLLHKHTLRATQRHGSSGRRAESAAPAGGRGRAASAQLRSRTAVAGFALMGAFFTLAALGALPVNLR